MLTHVPRIASVETFIVSIPRDEPYLGGLGKDEQINPRGYLIRNGNKTIYPTTDMSVLIKVTAEDGTVGWGETYGIVAPEAVTAIIDDVLGPAVVGRDPRDAVVIQEDLYDLMRVRGFFGGFYVDAIAGVDIAIWDLFGKLVGQPVVKLIGGQRLNEIPAYVSGLPGRTLDDSCRACALVRHQRLQRLQVSRCGFVRWHCRRDASFARRAWRFRRAHGRSALEVHCAGSDTARGSTGALASLFHRSTVRARGHGRAGASRRTDSHAAGAGRGMAHGL